jgi:hypothetical protein
MGLVPTPDPYAVHPTPIATTAAATAAAAADPASDAASPEVAAASAAAAAMMMAMTSAAATAMMAVTSAAAAAMMAVTSAASAAMAVTSAAVPVTPAAMAMADKFNGGLGRIDVFLIEDIERRQGNVGDFLFPEGYLVALSRRQSGHIGCGASGNCRCRAR